MTLLCNTKISVFNFQHVSYYLSKQYCCKTIFTKIISEKSKLTKVGNTDNNKQEVVTNDEVSFQLCVLYVFTKGNFLKVLVVEKRRSITRKKGRMLSRGRLENCVEAQGDISENCSKQFLTRQKKKDLYQWR